MYFFGDHWMQWVAWSVMLAEQQQHLCHALCAMFALSDLLAAVPHVCQALYCEPSYMDTTMNHMPATPWWVANLGCRIVLSELPRATSVYAKHYLLKACTRANMCAED